MLAKSRNLFFWFAWLFCMLLLTGCMDFTAGKAERDRANADSYKFNPLSYTSDSLGSATGFGNTNPPTKVTVLLPLSGRLAGSGQAIRNAFLVANDYAKKQNQSVPDINFVDTNQADIYSLYQNAVQNGSDFVVGPLVKTEVSALMQSANLTVPVLALNTVDDYSKHSLPNLYQFGLSPQDEVLQVSDRILRDGHNKALVIVPNNDWGKGLVATFQNSFSHGGKVIDILFYDKKTDFTQAIAEFLKIDMAQLYPKGKGKAKAKPEPLNLETVRRQDFDSIFLVANPEDGRQIRPLLKFYYVGRVPIYSTSFVYSGASNPQADFDLDDIIFCDLPWVLRADSQLPSYVGEVRMQIFAAFPASSSQTRKLYALGVDAYNLMRFLKIKGAFPTHGLAGATGALYLDSYHHIYRRLDWAKMSAGAPQLVQ